MIKRNTLTILNQELLSAMRAEKPLSEENLRIPGVNDDRNNANAEEITPEPFYFAKFWGKEGYKYFANMCGCPKVCLFWKLPGFMDTSYNACCYSIYSRWSIPFSVCTFKEKYYTASMQIATSGEWQTITFMS